MDEKPVEALVDLLARAGAEEHGWLCREIAKQMLASINASGTHRVVEIQYRGRAPAQPLVDEQEDGDG